jgi:murein L,D-transpeptidase YafK
VKKSVRERLKKILHSPGRDAAGGLLSFLFLAVCLVPAPTPAADAGPQNEPWLLVDSGNLTLTVMHDDRPRMTLHNIAIGRYGTSLDKRRGDKKTPLGHFRITEIRRETSFHRFIALDYPGIEHAEKGHREGVISQHELQAILRAHRLGKAPPQHTALGGNIGIHGLGLGDLRLHETMNWTRGCVALTDEQVDALLSWARVGMTVEIR